MNELPPELVKSGGRMGEALRSFDWDSSELGPIDGWPQSLKTIVGVCLNSRFPILIWWGAELVKLYNDAYIELIGAKHPGAFGTPGRLVWPEIWPTIGPMLEGVLERGESHLAEDLYLPLERNGYPEECYFTFSYSPIPDESGKVAGVFSPVVETTEKVILARRLSTLHHLAAARPTDEVNMAEACKVAARVCTDNPYDLPCVWIYLFDRPGAVMMQDGHDEGATAHGPRKIGVLAGRTGGSCAEIEPLPQTIDLSAAQWSPLQGLMVGRECLLDVKAFEFPAVPLSPWGDPVEDAIALPLHDLGTAEPLGFMMAAVNPRKRMDATYRSFFGEVATAISISLREARTQDREARQRARQRKIFEQIPAGIAVLYGPELRFSFVNQFYVAMTQRSSAADLLGKPVREALSDLAGQPFFEWMEGVYATGETFFGQEVPAYIHQATTGRTVEVWVSFSCQPVRDVIGRIEGVVVHANDVTAQVLARKEIEAREAQFRALADSIPQLAWMAEPDGSIFWYNQRWYEYTGKTEAEMTGWGWMSLHDPHTVTEIVEGYRYSIVTGQPFSSVFPLRGKDGTMREFLTLAVPVHGADGQIVRWFGTNTDVDEQRRTQQALRQSEKLAAVGRLASSIAHEINNPLEAVVNLVFLAKSGTTAPEVRQYLDDAEHELARVAQIASHTLRFHKQQTAKAPADMAEVLQSVLTLYRGRLGREGIAVSVDIRPAPPLNCFAGEIRQVMANLVANALDAMPSGGRLLLRVRPSVDWRTGACAVRITVADTGHGMPAEVRKRVYEAFYTTRGATGTGLGLWVSAGIVDSHGGSMQVRSKVGCCSGTVFALVLPY